jgi:hypothetical protein
VMNPTDLEGLTPEAVDQLLASPLSPAELAELEADEAAIREAWLGMGEALSRLRYGLTAHRDQRTVRGRPIPTEAGRWRAYVEQHCQDTTPAEAEACMRAYHQELARKHHAKGVT